MICLLTFKTLIWSVHLNVMSEQSAEFACI